MFDLTQGCPGYRGPMASVLPSPGFASCGATIVFNDINQELGIKDSRPTGEGVRSHGYVCALRTRPPCRSCGPIEKEVGVWTSGEQRGFIKRIHGRFARISARSSRGPERPLHRIQGGDPAMIKKGGGMITTCSMISSWAGKRFRLCAHKGGLKMLMDMPASTAPSTSSARLARATLKPTKPHRLDAGAPFNKFILPRPGQPLGNHRGFVGLRCSWPPPLPILSTATCCT
jgi:hypothetical protein